jgi:hypothetical protein
MTISPLPSLPLLRVPTVASILPGCFLLCKAVAKGVGWLVLLTYIDLSEIWLVFRTENDHLACIPHHKHPFRQEAWQYSARMSTAKLYLISSTMLRSSTKQLYYTATH